MITIEILENKGEEFRYMPEELLNTNQTCYLASGINHTMKRYLLNNFFRHSTKKASNTAHFIAGSTINF